MLQICPMIGVSRFLTDSYVEIQHHSHKTGFMTSLSLTMNLKGGQDVGGWKKGFLYSSEKNYTFTQVLGVISSSQMKMIITYKKPKSFKERIDQIILLLKSIQISLNTLGHNALLIRVEPTLTSSSKKLTLVNPWQHQSWLRF